MMPLPPLRNVIARQCLAASLADSDSRGDAETRSFGRSPGYSGAERNRARRSRSQNPTIGSSRESPPSGETPPRLRSSASAKTFASPRLRVSA